MEDNDTIKTSIENLRVTEKTRESIKQIRNELSLRERQFLLMLISNEHHEEEQRNTRMSLCDNLVSKVNVNSLLNRGYLALKGDYSIEFPSLQIQSSEIGDNILYSTHSIQDNPSDKYDKSMSRTTFTHRLTDEQIILLKIASGNFDN